MHPAMLPAPPRLSETRGPASPRALSLLLGCLLPLALAVFWAPPLAAQGEDGEDPQEGSADAALQALEPRHREFLAEVAPLISEAERRVFLSLDRDYRRDAFMRQFWQVRDPYPETPRNELAERWDQRKESLREELGTDDPAEDRVRMFLLLGPPRDRWRASCGELLRPLEVWRYDGAGPIREPFHLVFAGGDLWYPSAGLRPLATFATGTREEVLEEIATRCPRGGELVDVFGSSLDLELVRSRGLRLAPDPGEEWLGAFESASTDLPEGARTLPGTLDLAFPGRRGSRTVVQGVVSIPASAAGVVTVGDRRSRDFLVDGEILREGELFDQFRYRFDFPLGQIGTGADGARPQLPLVVERYLRPGDYRLILRVQDLGSGAYLRRELDLAVPVVDAPPSRVATADPSTPAPGPTPGPVDEQPGPTDPPSPTPADLDALLAEANATVNQGDHTLRLLPPPAELVTGSLRVSAHVAGPEIARVSFHLDGRRVLAKTRPPYSVELSLGDSPRAHRLEAIAEGPGGEVLARDQVMVNAGPHRFSVRLLEPRRGARYGRSLRAQAVVEVPEGETLDRVEIYLDEERLATLYGPPFLQPIVLPPAEDDGPRPMSYVRATAYLEGGATAEDLVFINAPEHLEEMEVQFVELYTSVLDRRGRPVEGLTREAFRVLEDGEAQEVRRFELVKDLPVHAGIILDTSTSMNDRLEEAVEGALSFFRTVITPRDRAAVITFNDRPQLVARFTNDPRVLEASLAGLVAEGETALYDAVLFGLHYFSGIQGKRVLVLLSDGADVTSRYRFEDAIEYARRTGVALYTVGIDLSSRDTEARLKLVRLAEETGGRSFFIAQATELGQVYETIEEELRSQYLLAYQSAGPTDGEDGDEFREIEVEVAGDGLEAKTILGYYPR